MTPEQLKQSILQYAIQGKLVEQRSEEGTAEELYLQIRQEKQKLIKKGNIKKENLLDEITDDEIPFDVPDSWKWVKLGNCVTVLGDGIHGTPIYSPEGEYFFVNGNNLKDGEIVIKSDTKRVSVDEYTKYKKELNERTVLVSINGTIGNIAFYNGEKVILGKSACYFNLVDELFPQYIYWIVKSEYFLKYAYSNATGSTIKNVSLGAMRNFLIPLPPTKASVSNWELGKNRPDWEVLSKLVDIFPSRTDELLYSYINRSNTNTDSVKMKNNRIADLHSKACHELEKYKPLYAELPKRKICFVTRVNGEEVFCSDTHHVLFMDFITKLRELGEINNQIITVKGKYNSMVFSYLLGATRVYPIEWSSRCPSCGSDKCVHNRLDDMNGIDKCVSCGNTFISQYCEFPYSSRIVFRYSCPQKLEIDVSPSFLKMANDIAVAYFSPFYSLKKQVYKEKGIQYYALILDDYDCEIECDSIEKIPEVEERQVKKEYLDCNPTIIIRPEEQNQIVSERLFTQKPDLMQVYGVNNIANLAGMLKMQLPEQLQTETDSICTINQLINMIIVINNYRLAKEDKTVDWKTINQLKRTMHISDWTCLPFTREDYRIWKEKDKEEHPENWEYKIEIKRGKKTMISKHKKADLDYAFDKYGGGKYSKGEYNDVLYRLLLTSYFLSK